MTLGFSLCIEEQNAGKLVFPPKNAGNLWSKFWALGVVSSRSGNGINYALSGMKLHKSLTGSGGPGIPQPELFIVGSSS